MRALLVVYWFYLFVCLFNCLLGSACLACYPIPSSHFSLWFFYLRIVSNPQQVTLVPLKASEQIRFLITKNLVFFF